MTEGREQHGEWGDAMANVEESEWPEAVSDGLTIPCMRCGEIPAIDYRVDDDFWSEIARPHERKNVICIECLCRDHDGVINHLQEVQVVNAGQTGVLRLVKVFDHWYTCRRCDGTGDKPEGPEGDCLVCEGAGWTRHRPSCHAACYSTGVCTCGYEPPSSEQNRTGRAFEPPEGRTRAVAAAAEALRNSQGNSVYRRDWLARRAIDAALAEGGVVEYEEHRAMVTAKDDWKEAQEITNEQRKAAEARVRELEEERDKLRQAMPDPDSLDSIAGWFEVRYRRVPEIQRWCRVLRTSARLVRGALEESETQEGQDMSTNKTNELCGAYHPRGACPNPCELDAGHKTLHVSWDNEGREYQWSHGTWVTDPEPIGRDSAVQAATQAVAEAADEFAASPEVFAELAVDAALANGGVVVRQELENMVDRTTESANRRLEDLKRRVSIVVDSTFGMGVRNEDLKNRLLTVINQTLDTGPGLCSGCGYIATECRCSSLNLD